VKLEPFMIMIYEELERNILKQRANNHQVFYGENFKEAKMPYEAVKVTCHFCGAKVEGNQRFMTGGHPLPGCRGRRPSWLKIKPEHEWIWNGLSEFIDGERISFEVYLCPKHNDQKYINRAFKWARDQIDGHKALAKLLV